MPYAADSIGSSRDACRVFIYNFLRHWSYRKDVFDDELELWVDNFMKPGNLQGRFNWYLSNHASRMAGSIASAADADKRANIPFVVRWPLNHPILLSNHDCLYDVTH